MRSVVYSVTDNEKTDLDTYARSKGLKDAGALARFAVARYMAQFPISMRQGGKSSRRGTPVGLVDEFTEARARE
jgi:hypothetical protein